MSEMVDLVARAILDDTPEWTGEMPDSSDELRRITVGEYLERTHLHRLRFEIAQCAARAAILAMRKPTEAMERVARGSVTLDEITNGDELLAIDFAWPLMIDAALGDPV